MNFDGVIRYQSFNGLDGLQLAGDKVNAYSDRELVATADAPEGTPLAELLSTYRIPELFPDLKFAWADPETFDISVTLDPASLTNEIGGAVTVNGDEHAWQAIYGAHPDFRRHDELPVGSRPYGAAAEKGWELLLPLTILQTPDPVLTQRLACAIEAYVHAVATGTAVANPHRTVITNVFSADAPTWRLNLPRVIPPAERRAYL